MAVQASFPLQRRLSTQTYHPGGNDHTGGSRLGFDGRLCGRLSSLNHRVDTAQVLDWLDKFI
jgi:hypothetical protein